MMKSGLSFVMSLVVLFLALPFAWATDADTTFREAIRIAHATTGSVLVTGKVLIGDSSNLASAHAVSGDVVISTNGVTAIAAGVVVNADIAAAAAIELTKLEAVAPTYIVVGNAASQAVAVVVSGDATMSNAGAVSLAARSVAGEELEATAPGYLLVGSASSNAEPVAVSGDITMSNAGAVAIASGAVVNVDVNASAAIALTKLAAVAPTYIVVGNASSQAVAVAVSGDATIDNAGALTVTGAAGDFAVVGTAEFTSTALDVTNGQAVAISSGSYVLTGIDGANNTTNTITIDAPSAAGQLLFLTVASSSTNLVTIADSSPVAASGAILLDGNDSALLIGVDASTWSLVSESDNN